LGKPEMKGPRIKWKFNIQIDLKEIRCKVIELAQGRDKLQAVVSTVMNFSGFHELCAVPCIP
jgi:hypothetical protein